MPLLSDSKSVYVGTTPITKVMAAGVQVWPNNLIEIIEFEDQFWNAFRNSGSDPNARLCCFTWRAMDTTIDLCELWINNNIGFRLQSTTFPNSVFSHNGTIPGTQAPSGLSRCYVKSNTVTFSDSVKTDNVSLVSYSTKCSICQFYNGSIIKESQAVQPNTTEYPYPPLNMQFSEFENIC